MGVGVTRASRVKWTLERVLGRVGGGAVGRQSHLSEVRASDCLSWGRAFGNLPHLVSLLFPKGTPLG